MGSGLDITVLNEIHRLTCNSILMFSSHKYVLNVRNLRANYITSQVANMSSIFCLLNLYSAEWTSTKITHNIP
jgi:hypothetical protein